MFEKIIVVDHTEQKTAKNGTAYLEVVDKEGKKQSVFDQGLWQVFQDGRAIKLGLEKEGTFWNLKMATRVEDELPPPVTPKMPADAPKPTAYAEKAPTPATQVSGQEVGMTMKEVRELYRDKMLAPLFGQEVAFELIKWYRGRILGTTRVPFDGAKLPTLKTKEE